MRVIRYSQSSCFCGLILIIRCFLAFLINCKSVEAVLFIGHFSSNHINIDGYDHWRHYISG